MSARVSKPRRSRWALLSTRPLRYCSCWLLGSAIQIESRCFDSEFRGREGRAWCCSERLQGRILSCNNFGTMCHNREGKPCLWFVKPLGRTSGFGNGMLHSEPADLGLEARPDWMSLPFRTLWSRYARTWSAGLRCNPTPFAGYG